MSKKKENMFQHSLFVPVDFALAIYNIMHNKAILDDWDIITRYKEERYLIYVWIKDILETNKVENVEKEVNWFKKQIGKQ